MQWIFKIDSSVKAKIVMVGSEGGSLMNQFLEKQIFNKHIIKAVVKKECGFLEVAKKYGKVTAGLMTDAEILTKKKKKPVVKFKHRKKLLSYISVINKIIPVTSINFVKYAKKYKFDYWVHGDDWKKGVQAKERLKLIKTMKKWNGKVIDVPYTKGISSSILKET